MLRESTTAVVARNELWRGDCATEPFEAGWATEAVIFIRALKTPVGLMPDAYVEISPDGMHWVKEGSVLSLPLDQSIISLARVVQFGNWLRISATLPEGAETNLLITIHLK